MTIGKHSFFQFDDGVKNKVTDGSEIKFADDQEPFGLLFKQRMFDPEHDSPKSVMTRGTSPAVPTQTPRGSDPGAPDVYID